MDKFIYNLVLQPGTDEAEFLANEAAGMQVKSNLNMFDGLLCMLLTEEEAAILENSPKVLEIVLEPKAEPTFYPTETLEKTKTLITRSSPSTSALGSDHAGTHFYHCSEQGGENASGPIGFFTDQGEDANIPGATIKQKFAGRYVDIIALEANFDTPITTYDGYEDHADFKVIPKTFNITVTADGSSAWLVTGGDRIFSEATGSTPISNRIITIYPGDTINITNNASSSHPLELVYGISSLQQVPNVTNQGAFGGQTLSWTSTIIGPGGSSGQTHQPYIVKYRCTSHPLTMIGNISAATSIGSRFVKTDWDTYDAGIADIRNNQITNDTAMFEPHAIGVLSAAGGLYCGWAKESSLRVIYLEDGVTACYNAILNFHTTKPVNPETGVRNATIVTGAFGYPTYAINFAVPVDNVTSIEAYDEQGNLTTINRPGASWGTDFTPFVDNFIVPRLIEDYHDSTTKWMIPYNTGAVFSQFKTAMDLFAAAGGIYHFKSAGNYGNVGVRVDDPRVGTRINIDDASNVTSLPSGTNGYVSFPYGGAVTNPRTCAIIDSGGVNVITVAAGQNSTVNPLLDAYSTRGPCIDITGTGAYTWTAYPTQTYADGLWGYFSGTSCAAPQAAGAAAVIIDNFFTQRGVYPTIQQLKDIMTKNAKPLEGESVIDWSNVPSPADYAESRLVNSNDVYAIKQNDNPNGLVHLADLHGTPSSRIFIPWGITNGPGQYIGVPNGRDYGRRPASGQTYPRRKIRVGA